MKNSPVFLSLAAVAVSLIAPATVFAGPGVRVPEPTTLSLIGAGAVVLAASAWWRNRK